MSSPGAFRGTNKVMQRCPDCGSRKPKELVEGEKQFDAITWLIVSVVTCGFGLILFPMFMKRSLVAYCHECDYTFRPNL